MTTVPESTPTTAEIYWRPGCPYCSALRRDLERRAVPAVWRNIWADEEARAFVRSVKNGNETVPTVRVGSTTLTNPAARASPDSSAATSPPRRGPVGSAGPGGSCPGCR